MTRPTLPTTIVRFLVLGLALAAGTAHAQRLPDPQDEAGFVRDVAQRLKAAMPGTDVRQTGPHEIAVADLGKLSVDNVLVYCRGHATECPATVTHFVDGIAQAWHDRNTPPTAEQVRAAIRSEQRMRDYEARMPGLHPVTRPFVPGLVEVAVIDSPSTVRYVVDKDIAALQLERARVLDLAEANTRLALTAMADVAKPAVPGHVGHVEGNADGYDASRLLFPAAWAALAQAQHGTLVVALPRPPAVYYIAEDSPQALAALRAVARESMAAAPDGLSDVLLRWTPDGWVVVP